MNAMLEQQAMEIALLYTVLFGVACFFAMPFAWFWWVTLRPKQQLSKFKVFVVLPAMALYGVPCMLLIVALCVYDAARHIGWA